MKGGVEATHKNLRVCFWNINGRKFLIKSEKIQSWLNKNFDIVFLSETHLVKGEKYKLPSFTDYHNPYSDHMDRKPRGGVSCFISNSCEEFVEDVDQSSSDHILIRFTNGTIVFSTYVAPADSPYYDPLDFSNVANAFVPARETIIFGGGDLNGRVGDIPRLSPPANGCYRTNCDGHVNEHGREIMNICNSFGCYVVNNLNMGGKTFDGNFTFRKGTRCAQNDVVLANQVALSFIKQFTIHREGWNPSDHYPISVECTLTFTKKSSGLSAAKDILTERISTNISRAKKVKPEDVDWDKYVLLVEGDLASYKHTIDNLAMDATLPNLNAAVSALNSSINRSAKLASKIPHHLPSHPVDAQTDSELFDLATAMLRRYEKSNCTLEEYELARTAAIDHLRSTSTKAERNKWSLVLSENDSKALWEKIDWKGTINDHSSSDFPELEDLRDQFLMKSETSDDSTLLSEVDLNQYVPDLDDDIQVEEIEKAHLVLKENKSTADGWTKRMITCVPIAIMLVFQVIYNSILKRHVYPGDWRTTIVNAIFKNKGSRLLAAYYRGISIVFMMAKIFDIILLNRFKKWFKASDQQTAYQSDMSTADHVFLQRCLIAFARKAKEKLFIISIDFDGAFDRVSRSVLIKKLCKFGAGSLFVACIASMYLKTDNIIFQGSDYITYTLYAGIKQGLPLSPLLFLFYVNDIFCFFQSAHTNTKNIIYEIVHVLMHADDANILASSRDIAIAKLKTLLSFCGLNCIIPQYKKCQFIAINGDANDTQPLPFGGKTLQHVPHLETLGSHLSARGSLEEDLQLHFKARYKACIKFYNFLRENKLAPLIVKLNVLKACVTNSFLYNCETFGNLIPTDLEKTYNKLLRRTLNVRPNTPALTLYIESGFLPITSLIHARQLKFYSRYRDRAAGMNTPRAQLFARLLSEPTSYMQHYINLCEKYDSPEDVYKKSSEEVKERLRSCAENNQYKYEIYGEINPNLVTSPFLGSLNKFSGDIIRFRLGSHNLPIETGRWSRIPRDERLCGVCKVLGDEKHALFDCQTVDRSSLTLPNTLGEIWNNKDVFNLFERLDHAKLLN